MLGSQSSLGKELWELHRHGSTSWDVTDPETLRSPEGELGSASATNHHLTTSCIPSAYPRSTCVEAGGMPRFVRRGPQKTNPVRLFGVGRGSPPPPAGGSRERRPNGPQGRNRTVSTPGLPRMLRAAAPVCRAAGSPFRAPDWGNTKGASRLGCRADPSPPASAGEGNMREVKTQARSRRGSALPP